jgi:predicted O-methyltransferase YrrM
MKIMDPNINSAESLDRWFRRVQGEFSKVASRFAGKRITYVEIGCWGGGSAEWTAKNILTHPQSRGVGIDPYQQDQTRRCFNVPAIRALAANRLRDAIGDRWIWIREPSIEGLKNLSSLIGKIPIDLLYIDGLHEAHSVVQDFALAWPMLRAGSVVIFDDYQKKGQQVWPHVKEGVQAIEIAFAGLVKPIHCRRQYAMEVIRTDLPPLKEREGRA